MNDKQEDENPHVKARRAWLPHARIKLDGTGSITVAELADVIIDRLDARTKPAAIAFVENRRGTITLTEEEYDTIIALRNERLKVFLNTKK